jgi:organic hydroperoxide reductase OsmC/OhrA
VNKQHTYNLFIEWKGNMGKGTSGYSAYNREHIVSAKNKISIQCSSDAAFRGDKTKYNPEELLVASVATCHMLWYLHLCADAGVVVTDYKDNATGTMEETEDGGGFFNEITLYPQVIVKDTSMIEKANALHARANKLCFIANSVKFPVHHRPVCIAEENSKQKINEIG